MKKITVEMPDNIDCLLITYLQSVSLGNINVGQRIVGNKDISDGSVVVIDTSKTDAYFTGGVAWMPMPDPWKGEENETANK